MFTLYRIIFNNIAILGEGIVIRGLSANSDNISDLRAKVLVIGKGAIYKDENLSLRESKRDIAETTFLVLHLPLKTLV